MSNVKEKPQSTTEEFVELFDLIGKNEHEQVSFCYDEATGLKAIIAIHNTVLGPALGGTRMWTYASDMDALVDVLRLSRGMTYKASISGLNLGGGKAVIIGDSYNDKSEALWRRYGKFVEGLNGRYITAEDVGTSIQDIEYVSMETSHCAGVPEYLGGSGDPSPVTAYGTYMGMKAAAKKAYGNDSLSGKKILVQGCGHVGQFLVKHLAEENAEIFVSDINEDRIKEIAKDYKITNLPAYEIFEPEIDIYAPCALGATINDDTIELLKCQIVAGAANNQLKNEVKHGQALKEKGIIYAPDFLINAGGLINCYSELEGFDRNSALGRAEKIYTKTLEIFDIADRQNITTNQAAIELAQKRIDSMALVNSKL